MPHNGHVGLAAFFRRIGAALTFSGMQPVGAGAGGGVAIAVSRRAPARPLFSRIGAALSLLRPGALPDKAPAGRVARPLRFDSHVEHPGHGVTPRRVVEIFKQAECGLPQAQCDLIDDLVENDAHLRSLFEQRAQAVAGKPWVVQADGSDGDSETAARVLGWALRRLPLVSMLEHLLTFNRYGWAATEVDWGLLEYEGRAWIVPTWLANVPARRFRIDPERDELRLVTKDFDVDGEPLAPGKWLVVRRSGSSLARAGLMRTAAWYACFKKFSTRDWVVYAEKYGLPLTLAKYGDGLAGDGSTDDPSRAVAAEIVRNIGNDGGAVVPKSIDVEIKEAGRDGNSAAVHGALIAYCNSEMSKLVNGSTLANDNAGSGGASYALGEVHASSRWDNIQADNERLQEAVRLQLAIPFMHYNGLKGSAPLLKIQVVRDLQPAQRAAIAKTLAVDLGMALSDAQLRQECGFKEPASESDAVRGRQPAAPAGAPAQDDQEAAA